MDQYFWRASRKLLSPCFILNFVGGLRETAGPLLSGGRPDFVPSVWSCKLYHRCGPCVGRRRREMLVVPLKDFERSSGVALPWCYFLVRCILGVHRAHGGSPLFHIFCDHNDAHICATLIARSSSVDFESSSERFGLQFERSARSYQTDHMGVFACILHSATCPDWLAERSSASLLIG